MNITELARKLKITPKELKQELPSLGFHIGPRAIQIPNKQAERVMEIWHEKKKRKKELEQAKEKLSKKSEKKEIEIKEDEKVVKLPPNIQVYRLAEKLNVPLNKVMNELIKNGVLVSVNESLDYEIAAIIAENLDVNVEEGEAEDKKQHITIKQKLENTLAKEDKTKFQQRAPIVVVMGHVDHGKSSILDAIRESKIVDSEKGGITQHIGAYQVKKNNHLITFIDTPGHEAFQAMRIRGGAVADIAILVIAADDKIQPQTLESIKIIQQEELPFIVAINKIDKPDADIKKIKKELADINLMPEDWGGKVICVPVSAKTKDGIDDLLEMLNLVAEMIEDKLVTNPSGNIVGVVIEAHLDLGLGPVATLILFNGKLKKGDNVIIGQSYGRLRSIKNHLNELIDTVPPSLPVQIFGIKSVPIVGDDIEVISDNKEFKKKVKRLSRLSLKKEFFGAADKEKSSTAENGHDGAKRFNIILRADVLGSLEALVHSLEQLNSPEASVKIIKKGLGSFTDSDVDLAKTVAAQMIGFGVKVSSHAHQLAKDLNLKINIYAVIYDAIHYVKEELNKLLPDEIIEQDLGRVEVLKIFQIKGKNIILGGRVTKGKIIKDSMIRIWKADEQELIGEGIIKQLQINKKDVKEAKESNECGIKFVGTASIDVGDTLEVYQEIKKPRKT